MNTLIEITKWGEHQIGWLESDGFQNAVEALKEGLISGIGLSVRRGFLGENLNCVLDAFPDLRVLVIVDCKGVDCGEIAKFRKLRLLSVSEAEGVLDLSSMVDLKDLSLVWYSPHKLPEENSGLQRLYIRKYASKDNSLDGFPRYSNLRTLEFVDGKINKLQGIDRFQKLKSFGAAYLGRLQDITSLSEIGVNEVTFEACKRIEDFSVLSKSASIRILRLLDCGTLDSLKFVREMKNLEEFRFIKTWIGDGDMSPLLKLKRVGFLKRRGYSHTPEEIKKIIGQEISPHIL